MKLSNPGDVIAEIETDKAVMEVEAIEEGRIGKLYVPEGAMTMCRSIPRLLWSLTEDDGRG